MRELKTSLYMTAVLVVLTGLVYPLAVTGLAQFLFPCQANGSMLDARGREVGSALIGQPFTAPGYFHGRPSASGYDPMDSGATNYGPLSRRLIAEVKANVKQAGGGPGHPVPVGLATSSASGLDPDITLAGALFQVPRVAAARHLAPARLRALVLRSVTPRQWGFLGEERVNVLRLNLALDRLAPTDSAPAPPQAVR